MSDKNVKGCIVGGIGLSPDASAREACNIAASEMKRAGYDPALLDFNIYKRSVDARKKNSVKLVYSVSVRAKNGASVTPPKKSRYNITPLYDEGLKLSRGDEKMTARPLVVGMGPAGLFCALLLAENGYAPIIIDRGASTSDRAKAYERFVSFGILDGETNIQFGAGGAGTFSDGKLLTRVNDPRVSYVLDRFCEFGAPEDIKVNAKPHIGTDLLLGVVDAMLEKIEVLGGSVIYKARLDGIKENTDGTVTAKTTVGDINCSAMCLATGHSARDTYGMLIRSGYTVEPKPFSVGVRIEHLQKEIDEALYGDFAGHEKIGKGEYHLSDTTGERGVYTFCMCPGGQVVAAASEEGGVVVNGMSNFARDGLNANSAVCVSVRPEDHGGTPMSAITFQRELERRAFEAGGRDYSAPVQTVGDFLDGRTGTEPTIVRPSYRNGKVKIASMEDILPTFVCDELKMGLLSFDRRVRGFAAPYAVLSGVETRTSSPVRIKRDDSLQAINHTGVYPCGEGAGYAGGITSAALDGIKVAEKIIERFSPYGE